MRNEKVDAKSDHYMLVGMPMTGLMYFGMGLMAVGYAAVLYGLAPRFSRGPAHEFLFATRTGRTWPWSTGP